MDKLQLLKNKYISLFNERFDNLKKSNSENRLQNLIKNIDILSKNLVTIGEETNKAFVDELNSNAYSKYQFSDKEKINTEFREQLAELIKSKISKFIL